MGRTIIEKIIQQHTREEVRPGKIVWMDLDIRSARDFGGPNVVKNYQREYGKESLDDPNKTFFTFDLCVPACSLKYAVNSGFPVVCCSTIKDLVENGSLITGDTVKIDLCTGNSSVRTRSVSFQVEPMSEVQYAIFKVDGLFEYGRQIKSDIG